MNAPDDHAGEVWNRVLPEIRRTRRRRANQRIVAPAAAAFLLAGAWLALRTAPAPEIPVVVHAPPELPVVETLAVMRVGNDGTVRLEELPSDQLGAVELAFGMTPVVSDNPPEW